MHLCPGNWVVIGRAVVYYARDAHTFSAEIKCPHCTCTLLLHMKRYTMKSIITIIGNLRISTLFYH